MNSWRVIEGDALERLRELDDGCVQTCVTSPPYFGLRDYGTGEWVGGEDACDHVRWVASKPDDPGIRSSTLQSNKKTRELSAGTLAHLEQQGKAAQYRDLCGKCGATRTDSQLGLETTPDEYVARLVDVFREVKRVLRDDGTLWLNLGDSYASSWPCNRRNEIGAGSLENGKRENRPPRMGDGMKEKDLMGIPWMVAFALRQPYYAGRIANELDRVWLAAMIDAEGCVYIHRRRAGQGNGQGYERKTDSFGSGLEVANTNLSVVERCKEITGRGSISRQDKDRRQPLYRWCLRTNECRDVLREVYPYLVAKQHEARLACGVPSSGPKATAAWEALKLLHGGSDTTVDFAAPESLHTPGWYLRSDVIWSKLNPMPESVTDRPTKAHEYVFLLSKSPRYFYDADAVREQWADERNGASGATTSKFEDMGSRGRGDGGITNAPEVAGRNKRSVWTVATQPFPGAHFAVFPPKLIEPCVKAGSAEDACGVCGAPWVRVVERTPMVVRPTEKRADWQAEDDHARTQVGGTMLEAPESRTVGFEPSCSHQDKTGSSTVLDPFSGAGTTGLVATRLGRSYIGIELNPAYAEMSRERIRDDAPLMNYILEREEVVPTPN